jgi:hypothetical protein
LVDARDQSQGEASRPDPPPRAPRWVKVFGLVAVVLIVVFVILHLAFGGLGNLGDHGWADLEHGGDHHVSAPASGSMRA